jgi:hypothetical protein
LEVIDDQEGSRFYDSRTAAQFLILSPRTLENIHFHGGGINYRKIGKRVLYAIADLGAYANSQRGISTSQDAA